MKRLTPLLLPLALVACQDATPLATPEAAAPDAATLSRSAAGEALPGRYIVVFREGVGDASTLARRLIAENGGELRSTYSRSVRGFSARLPERAVEALRRHPQVAWVEPDRLVHLASQANATWGIDRVDQRDLPLSTTYEYSATGEGVTVYVVDSGINAAHTEFAGRIGRGFDAFNPNGNGAVDCNGHGTHVAGTVGGTVYGVAKGARIVPVRTFECASSTPLSAVIDGVEWITANHVQPAVANMSLGGGVSDALDAAVAASIAAGVTYVIASGNGAANACNASPARVAAAITVGGTTIADQEYASSNFGTCVDILAPAVSVTSAWWTRPNSTASLTGTSMAAPHVAGAAALFLQRNPGASPAEVSAALVANATPGRIALGATSASAGTPNLLLYTGFLRDFLPPENKAPTAAFAVSCTGATCAFSDRSFDLDGSIVSRAWSFGDGATSTATDPQHGYAGPGIFPVTLTVTDDQGATATSSRNVVCQQRGQGLRCVS